MSQTQTTTAGVDNLYVGKLRAQPGRMGARALYANAHLTHHEGEFETVNHEKITQYDEVSISWTVFAVSAKWTYLDGVPESDSQWLRGGQVPPEERKVMTTSTRLGLPDRQSLEQLWVDWHLNGMNAGCAHMPKWDEIEKLATEADYRGQFGTIDPAGWAIKNLVCPETGYTWGKKWLVRPLPAERRARVLEIIRENQR